MNQMLKPMLCSTLDSPELPLTVRLRPYRNAAWWGQEKFDGWRVVMRKTGQELLAWGRKKGSKEPTRIDIPSHLVKAFLLFSQDFVLDGELWVPGGNSNDVNRRGVRDQVFVLFDVLELFGRSARAYTHEQRHQMVVMLGQQYDRQKPDGLIRVPETWAVTAAKIEAIWKRGGEGAILKRRDSKYVSRRSPDWIKVKKCEEDALTIVGFAASENGRPYGKALLRDDQGYETSCKVPTDQIKADIAKDPAKYDNAQLIIRFQERTRDGSYRNPVWRRLK